MNVLIQFNWRKKKKNKEKKNVPFFLPSLLKENSFEIHSTCFEE